MVGYREEIIAIRTVSCGDILGIVRTVGEVRVHMQIAYKRIHTDEITGDGIDTESEAFLIAIGVFALDADVIFALMRKCYRNIKSVFFVCGHIEFFSESGRRVRYVRRRAMLSLPHARCLRGKSYRRRRGGYV